MYCKAKKNFGAIRKILNFFFLKIYLTFFEKFSDRSKICFCFTILKKLNKSCYLDKKNLFLKKKVVSLKKTSFENF